jgi:L-alanine-DL-glutamate epimerase-like enolase superfamily enzyme
MELSVRIERWLITGAFAISRGSKTEAVVVVAELSDGTHRGRGESVPYARYGETPDGIVAAIEAVRPAIRRGLDRAALQGVMAAGAARNALDCAYWDVNAKQTGRRAYELPGFVRPRRSRPPIPSRLRLPRRWQRRRNGPHGGHC